ncbi:MAG TPA: glycosyltransferase, partial [Candidatus Saccharimonadales bacterium]|nr:glycosyltransferase [Candidatus Saccharimonadales bacterium]
IAKELGIETNVIFRGFINGPEKYNLLQSSAALVAYPTTENDAFPTVILEAWAVGTPVIAADMGALHTLIKNNNGKLVKSHSPEHLARAISGVLSNDHQWKLFSDNGRKIVAGSFNWAVSGRNTIAHFEVITRPKICVINNIIAPYRIPVFDGLSGKADVMALFCKPIAKDRFWKYDLDKVGFKYKVLPGFTLGPIIINPTAWWVLMRTKFDVVVCNNDPDVATVGLTSFLLAKLKRARCVDWSSIIDDEVHTFDGQAEGLAVKVTRVVIKRYRMLFISLSDVHMAFSPGAVAYLRNKNVPESKIIRVLNAMPRVLLDNPSTKATHRRNGKKVLYIGYLNARKNVELLIEAFLQINDPDASLTIAGDGDRKEELLTLAKKDKRIKFLGYVEGKVKADLFAASDIFVLPTTNDVWGLVINEALTYNLAVICSDEAEAKELINDKSGRVFRSGDVKSLLSLLNELLSDRRKVQAMQLYNFNRHDLPTTDDMVNGVMKACRVRLV